MSPGDVEPDPFEPFDEPGGGSGEPARESGGGSGQPAREPAPEHDFPGKALFAARSPREILRRLTDEDPLEIDARAAERLRERALLLEHEHLVLRAMARVALAGFSYRGDPPLDAWLMERIDDAIADLLSEDEEAEHSGLPPSKPFEERLLFIADITGLEPLQARRACLRFNSLPESARVAFFQVVIAQTRFNRYVAEGHGPPDKLREQLMSAFRALSLPLGPGFDGGPES